MFTAWFLKNRILDHLYRLGQTLGRIHRVGSVTSFLHRPALSPARMATDSRLFVETDFVPVELQSAYRTLAHDCDQAATEILSSMTTGDLQRVHGDCHVGNILWRDDTPHFVDLDDCISGPVVQDIWMFLNGNRSQREHQLADFIEGYGEFNDFDARQLSWIEALRTLRIMHHAGWLACRWGDPAFPKAFPWFGQQRFWADHILELREHLSAMHEAPLRLL